ncbi:MAG: dTMP kinase [Chlamydiales bacterium]|nr:dTMP kinase [Chlamydiia bacterium]MCP5507295.1 dTMP kinase [Chlamydiales bacterium]
MRKSEHKGLFITLEGGEGTGKTTLIKRLQNALDEEGFASVATREPGGSPLGERIRQMLLSHDPTISIGSYAELLLFLAARAQHIEEVIAPALERGEIVLCDRFNDSTIVYQGHARGLGMSAVQQLCLSACHGVVPDITLFLDVDPEIGLARTKGVAKDQASEGQVDRIEREEIAFHQKVREGMHLLAEQEPERVHILDASQSVDEVFQQAWSLITQQLQRR